MQCEMITGGGTEDEQFVINELCTAARVVWHCDLISSAAMLSEGGRRDNSQAIATSEETKND